jgi:hypothetical protein
MNYNLHAGSMEQKTQYFQTESLFKEKIDKKVLPNGLAFPARRQ